MPDALSTVRGMASYFPCFDAIALGCLSAVLARRRPVEKRYARVLRALAGGAIAVLYLQGIASHEVFGFSLVALASAMFLYAAPTVSDAPGRVAAALGWLGRHSSTPANTALRRCFLRAVAAYPQP